MKVILLDEIKGKGGEGDVVEVAQGYAENFLFPKKLAVAATKGNLKQLDERRNNIAKREAVRLATANETKAAFEGKTVTVDVKVGDEGILFGSVTAAMIADAIKAQLGMDIDRKRVELGKPIKVAGAHTVAISLYREIKAEVVVLVGVTAEGLAAEGEAEETPAGAEAAPAADATAAAAEAHLLQRNNLVLRRALWETRAPFCFLRLASAMAGVVVKSQMRDRSSVSFGDDCRGAARFGTVADTMDARKRYE